MITSSIIQEDIETIVNSISRHSAFFSGKTIVLSGGSGFLGKYFCGVFQYLNQHVLDTPCKVYAIDNYITGSRDKEFSPFDDNIVQVFGDITQKLPIREKIDFIIHAAGLASPSSYMKYPMETIDSAVTGVRNLLELSISNDIEGFLFFSSSEIYGEPTVVPTPEDYFGYVSTMGPRSCYDESKRLAETVCSIYHNKYNVPLNIVRPFNVFGPGMKATDKRVMPMFALQSLKDLPLTVHGDGTQTRTFCYITDAMNGFFRALVSGLRGQAYNIGNQDDEIAMKDLAQTFVDMTGKGSVNLIPYPETYPAGETKRRAPDNAKSHEQLGYDATIDYKTGIARYLEWIKQAPTFFDTF